MMTTPVTDNTPDRQTVRKVDQGLDPLQQILLRLVAIQHESIHPYGLVKLLRELGIKTPQGRAVTEVMVMQALNALEGKGLLSAAHECLYPLQRELFLLAAESASFSRWVKVLQQAYPAADVWGRGTRAVSFERCLREVNIALHNGDVDALKNYLAKAREQFPDEYRMRPPLFEAFAAQFDPAWMLKRPLEMQCIILEQVVPFRLAYCLPVDGISKVLNTHRENSIEAFGDRFRYCLATLLILTGETQAAAQLLEHPQGLWEGARLRACLLLLRGEQAQALAAFESALKEYRQQLKSRKAFFDDLSGLFFLVAMLNDPVRRDLLVERLQTAIQKGAGISMYALAALLGWVNALRGQPANSGGVLLLSKKMAFYPLAALFQTLVQYWIDPKEARSWFPLLEKAHLQAVNTGHRWLAMESGLLLARMDATKGAVAGKIGENLRTALGVVSITTLVEPGESWERALQALVEVAQASGGTATSKGAASRRLIWSILPMHEHVLIVPKEQNADSRGWSKGRNIALKRLLNEKESFDFLTAQDHRILSALQMARNFTGQLVCQFDEKVAMPAMVGHPLVFWDDAPSVNVEVVKAEPHVTVVEHEGKLRVAFDLPLEERDVQVIRELPARCRVLQITPAHRKLAAILGKQGLNVPLHGREQVMTTLSSLASVVTVHSAVEGDAQGARSVEANATPVLFLLPAGEGFKAKMQVQPFVEGGPCFTPGQGGKVIFAEIGKERLQATRDFSLEKSKAAEVLSACPSLADGAQDQNGEWRYDDPEGCLQLLEEVHGLGEALIRVRWPEGERLRVSRSISVKDMRLQVRREGTWFHLEGDLKTDEASVLEMRRLLELMGERESRFVPLGDGTYLALTRALHKRLQEMKSFSEESGAARRMHPLAASWLEEVAAEVGAFKTDRAWNSHLKQMRQAVAMDPELPSTLQTELREYQREGFRWLARMAAWGVGACLADDMGLGKTVQAIALLLTRAPEGAALVVAPLSVTLNWVDELRRFAPTLNPIPFAGNNRQGLLEQLHPYDVVIGSYGMLQQEGEKLAAIPWRTVILDEAQAIKNSQTKRSQAAMALQGAFRLITTGTPVENHLGELWTLFRFLNPGLLGSQQRFNQIYAGPIERDHDKQASQRLKRLIQPFILRRLKSQVLEELPPRTEITLHVEMGPEESALYEALRVQATETLTGMKGALGQNHIRILAEITRLRRFCCHPALVAPEVGVGESAKLTLLGEVVQELLENRHKALIFSQFVDYLEIVHRFLQERGFSCHYLDGSTPIKERKRRIDAFQSGQGDLFLISLKAGGAGLNLTAADYVIHLDPWWNPAVEDQASDRAHRIGQERPVTVYRLVMRDTIEEKILRLHQHKRALADALLEGHEQAGRISAEELLQLIAQAE